MKISTIAGTGVGALATGIGFAVAILCPIGGLAAGAYFTYGALAATTMGTAATVALTAAGGVGGLLLGRIAAPIVALGALAVGGLLGGMVKLGGSLLEKVFSKGPEKHQAVAAPDMAAGTSLMSTIKGGGLSSSFGLAEVGKALEHALNDNASTKPKKTLRF